MTGAASGIGLAAARRFASLGMRLCLADVDRNALAGAGRALEPLLAGGLADLRMVDADVSKREDVLRLSDVAFDTFGDVALLMNNAATGQGAGPWEHTDKWRRLLDVNFFGVLHGLEAFVPRMIAQGKPAAIVNVGSKQGITTPPGNAAYNVSKAGVKVLTEQLAYELRQVAGERVTAHLLVPGYTFTAMTAGGAVGDAKKPPAAWRPEQVVEVLLSGLAAGDFYILCPDNEVTRALYELRIRWAAGDIIQNRPALSRWASQVRRGLRGIRHRGGSKAPYEWVETLRSRFGDLSRRGPRPLAALAASATAGAKAAAREAARPEGRCPPTPECREGAAS